MNKRKLNPIIVILLCAFCAVIVTVLVLHFVGYRYITEEFDDYEIKFIGMTKGGIPQNGKLYKSNSNGVEKGKLVSKDSAVIWEDGEKYTGDLNGFIYNGNGTLTTSDGTVIEGTFVNGIPQGQVKITYASGNCYEGEVNGFNLEGFGTYTWSDGSVYIGNFSDNQKNGYGYTKHSDGSVYIGEYKNSIKEGKGVYYFKNEDIYAGDFSADKRSGKGIYIFAKSEEFETEFDELFGNINFSNDYAKSFFDYFENEFLSHFLQVEESVVPGSDFWQKFEQILEEPVECYIGEFSDNLFEGNGTYIWLSGQKHSGLFSKGEIATDTDSTQNGAN